MPEKSCPPNPEGATINLRVLHAVESLPYGGGKYSLEKYNSSKPVLT